MGLIEDRTRTETHIIISVVDTVTADPGPCIPKDWWFSGITTRMRHPDTSASSKYRNKLGKSLANGSTESAARRNPSCCEPEPPAHNTSVTAVALPLNPVSSLKNMKEHDLDHRTTFPSWTHYNVEQKIWNFGMLLFCHSCEYCGIIADLAINGHVNVTNERLSPFAINTSTKSTILLGMEQSSILSEDFPKSLSAQFLVKERMVLVLRSNKRGRCRRPSKLQSLERIIQ